MKELNKKSSVFSWEGRPPITEIAPLSLQHVAAMVVGCVTPAIIISAVCKLSPADSVILIQSALIISGLGTLLQLFPIFGKIGSGLPVIMGASFAYLPTLIVVGSEFNLASILGSQLIGGAVAVLFGIFVKYLHKLFPPLVTGTVVFTIGLSLYPTAIKYMAGGAANPEFGKPVYWIIALITMAVVIFLNNFTKGFLRLASILVGIAVGYVIALFCGIVSFDSVAQATWLTVPMPLHFGLEFPISACITMAIMYIVNSVQAIGDLSATAIGGRAVRRHHRQRHWLHGRRHLWRPSHRYLQPKRGHCGHHQGGQPHGLCLCGRHYHAGRLLSKIFCPADHHSQLRAGGSHHFCFCFHHHDRHQAHRPTDHVHEKHGHRGSSRCPGHWHLSGGWRLSHVPRLGG